MLEHGIDEEVDGYIDKSLLVNKLSILSGDMLCTCLCSLRDLGKDIDAALTMGNWQGCVLDETAKASLSTFAPQFKAST